MGLMEPGCTRRDFGRDVQPAVPNRPRCWSWWDPRSERYQTTEADSTQHPHVFFLNGYSDQSISRSFDFLDSGGESVSSHGTSDGLEETPPTGRKRST